MWPKTGRICFGNLRYRHKYSESNWIGRKLHFDNSSLRNRWITRAYSSTHRCRPRGWCRNYIFRFTPNRKWNWKGLSMMCTYRNRAYYAYAFTTQSDYNETWDIYFIATPVGCFSRKVSVVELVCFVYIKITR